MMKKMFATMSWPLHVPVSGRLRHTKGSASTVRLRCRDFRLVQPPAASSGTRQRLWTM
ncbi:MAG: hypothetical protein ACLUJG_10120 [Lawsonibacter sp.]